MPDDLVPETNTQTTDSSDTVETQVDTDASNEEVYDAGVDELLGSDDEDDAGEETLVQEDQVEPTEEPTDGDEPEAEAEEEPEYVDVEVTADQLRAFQRANIDADALMGLPPEQVSRLAEQLLASQAEMDRLGAQRGREKQPEEGDAQAAAGNDQELSADIDKLMEDLTESYDEDIKPLGDVLKKVAQSAMGGSQQIGEMGQKLQAFEAMSDMMTQFMLNTSMQGLTGQYPSIEKPEVQQKVADRFWVEWNTGAHMKDGATPFQAMQSALKDAAKHVFKNTDETTAVANLVSKNKKRVASQPKVPNRNGTNKTPQSEDEVYDAAFDKYLT